MRVIDSQLHVYDRDSAAYPWSPKAAHVLKASEGFGFQWAASETAEDMIEQMREAGVDAAILVQCTTVYGFDNSYAINAIKRHPEYFGLVGFLDPASPTVVEDVDAFAANPGVVGVRVIGSAHYRDKFLDGTCEAMFRAARKNDLVVCLYAPDEPGDLDRIARSHPDVQFVLDHVCLNQAAPCPGEDAFVRLPELLALAQYPHIAVKLSGLPSLSREPFPFKDVWPAVDRLIDAFRPERLMWGTDTTRTRCAYRDEVTFLHEAKALSESEQALVFGQSLERIFKWSPRKLQSSRM